MMMEVLLGNILKFIRIIIIFYFSIAFDGIRSRLGHVALNYYFTYPIKLLCIQSFNINFRLS